MTIPDYQEIMLPLLKLVGDGEEHSKSEVIEYISSKYDLTTEERNALLPSGRQKTISNRIGWSRTYLKKAGLLNYPLRGFMKITSRGLQVLKENPSRIDAKYLEKFPEFIEFRTSDNKQELKKTMAYETKQTPQEALEGGYQKIKDDLSQELIETVKSCSPEFFEQLVIDLLVKMGYGGSRKEAGKRMGQIGDGGIDGTINQDILGLDIIYIQAKRWKGTVGRPEIQKFAGALDMKKANKGIFITTGDYSSDAKDFVKIIGKKIILIDGNELAELMIDHNVGVFTSDSYEIKKLDIDYFSEE